MNPNVPALVCGTFFRARFLLRAVSAVLGLLAAAPAGFSYSGVMAGQNQLRIARTDYFDIIYAPASARSAEILIEKADGAYRELAETFKLKHEFRMPVVITPAQDEFNAYFSFAPFNHIVLYDTVPTESMAVFSETLFMTFRHELTHAITYNLRNDFWYGFDRIFGDTYNPGALTITTAWAEGATVSVESDGGEGRLNDSYSLHIVRQAKIEGRFPNYSEINGTRDTYPYTTQSYLFGGMFSAWLQAQYGMEKYAEFWYKCVNFQTLTYFMCFRQVYGFSIRQAWRDFYDSVAVPEDVREPEADGAAALTKKSLWKSLSASENGAACLDGSGGAIYFAGTSGAAGAVPKLKKRLAFSAVSRIQLCADGRYMAVSYSSSAGRVPKNKVAVYDMASRRLFRLPEKGLRDAAVFCADGTYYVAAVRTESQYAAVRLYCLERSARGKIEAAALVREDKKEFGEAVFSPAGGSGGWFYYLWKRGMRYAVQAENAVDGRRFSVELPEGRMSVRNLSAAAADSELLSVVFGKAADAPDGDALLFSWAAQDTLPRLGVVHIPAAVLSRGAASESAQAGTKEVRAERFALDGRLMNGDVSGGIYAPVWLASGIADGGAASSGGRFAYIGNFYEGSRVFCRPAGSLPFSAAAFPVEFLSESERGGSDGNSGGAHEISAAPQELPGEPFSLFRYAAAHPKGTLVPLSVSQSYSIRNSAGGLDSVMLPLGATYVGCTPWTNPLWLFSAGYNPMTNSAAATAFLTGSTATELFSWSALASVEWDGGGYKQTYEWLSAAVKVPAGRTAYVSVSDTFDFFEGRQTAAAIPEGRSVGSPLDLFEILKTGDSRERLFVANEAAVSFGNIRKAGVGFYDYSGVEAMGGCHVHWCAPVSAPEAAYDSYQNLSVGVSGWIPRLLPIQNTAALTFNMPARLEAVLFPARRYAAAAQADIVLFSTEIQRSTSILPLFYANRLTVSARYLGKVARKSGAALDSWAVFRAGTYAAELAAGGMSYFDECAVRVEFAVTPDIGGLANYAFRFSLSAAFKYRFFPEPDERRASVELCSITVF